MTKITVTADQIDALGGREPAVGASITMAPFAPLFRSGKVTTTQPSTVPLVAGAGTLDVEASPAGTAYRLTPLGLPGLAKSYVVTVPSVTTVTLVDLLTKYQVDPRTLAPTVTPDAAWTVMVNGLMARVAALEAGGGGGGGTTPTTPFDLALAPPTGDDLPVIAVSDTAPSGTLNRELRSGGTSGPADTASDPKFLYSGAPAWNAQVNNPTLFVKPDLLPGGTAQAAFYSSEVGTSTSAPVVAFKVRVGAAAIGFRARVNRQFVSLDLSRFGGLVAGNTYYIVLTFPTAKLREVSIGDAGSSLAFGGVVIPNGYTLTRPAAFGLKVAAVLDSFGGGAYTPPDGATRLETWPNFMVRALEYALGVRIDFRNYAIGGTGWVATATPYSDRLDEVATWDPDVLIANSSINDGASGSGVQAAIAAGLSMVTGVAEVYVAGPLIAGYSANDAVTKAGTEAAGRVYLSVPLLAADDLNAVDKVHPTFLGHLKIARAWVAAFLAGRKLDQIPTGGGGGTPAPTYADVLDTFARTVSSGNTFGTTDNGKTWVPNNTSGTVVIDTDGAGYAASTTTLWNSIAAAANGVLSATRSKGAGKGGRLIFRQTGGSYLMFYGNGSFYAFTRIVNGTAGSGSPVVTTVVPADGDKIVVALDGNYVGITVNGTQVYSSTDVLNATGGVGVGIATFTGQLDSRFSRFQFTEKRA